MTSVSRAVDDYKAGKTSLDDLATDFSNRTWGPARAPSTPGQHWGAEDANAPGGDDWSAIECDSRITPGEYDVLAKARGRALKNQH